jgi:hypothetical protein
VYFFLAMLTLFSVSYRYLTIYSWQSTRIADRRNRIHSDSWNSTVHLDSPSYNKYYSSRISFIVYTRFRRIDIPICKLSEVQVVLR